MAALRQSLAGQIPAAIGELISPGHQCGLPVRRVPPLQERPAALAHPRLRRSSLIGQFAAAAAAEAVADAAARTGEAGRAPGVILATTCGCAMYMQRFYGEVLGNPATASPLLFPETVFNAPASHIATMLQSPAASHTLIGEAGVFLHGLALAAQWLQSGSMDACVVVAAEECDWTTAEGVRCFSKSLITAEGAGAVVVSRANNRAGTVLLDAITSPRTFINSAQKRTALGHLAAQLSGADGFCLLCPGLTGVARVDRAEAAAWASWTGAACHVKTLLGEGLSAGAAWQCLAAVDALREGRYRRAVVTVPGLHREAVGAAFVTQAEPPA